jgi:copper chaperone CopZ
MNKEFIIDGMSCGHCVMVVEKELNKLDIENKKVEIGSVKIEFDPDNVSEEDIKNSIAESGYIVIE